MEPHESSSPPPPRFFGCVIGVQRRRTVKIFNNFELLYDPSTHSLDRAFLLKKQELSSKELIECTEFMDLQFKGRSTRKHFSKYDYDVFLSFSHQDLNNTNHLYTALVDAGFRTYRDGDPINRSADIKSTVRKTINQSKFCVVVLSNSYVSSRWCLDQLLMIIEAKKNSILSVYYDLHQFEFGNHKGNIREVFARFEDQVKVENDPQIRNNCASKIKEWNEALFFAMDVQGFILQNEAQGDDTITNIIYSLEEKIKAAEEDYSKIEAEAEAGLLNLGEPSNSDEDWTAEEIVLRNVEELPENPNCPFLIKLVFQHSNDLTEIPDAFFESMPLLEVLDLSNTSIKTLPRSITRLAKLREFFLRGCLLLTELPPDIGELRNLEVFDLDGSELTYLPKEIGKLIKLERLKVSLYKYADNYIARKGIQEIIPRLTLSKFYHLKELNISVDPDSEWWNAEVEAVIDELPHLTNLRILNLYLPTLELLEKFLQLERQVYQNLSNFKLIVGHHQQHIISTLPRNLQNNFEKLYKCLIHVNGKENAVEVGRAIKHARALFLDRHWTIERLSEFKIENLHQLNSCLVVECNRMNTIVEGDDNGGKPILESLRYLSLHYMKNLQSIWRGPIVHPSLSCLEILALHTCPELTTIFNMALLCNLINLKELIIESCPKVTELVSLDPSVLEADTYFLLALKKIVLLDLPELVSVSGGVRIGPDLEIIFFSNCPLLKDLSQMNMYSKYMHEIKGEDEWLNDLHRSEIDYLRHVLAPLTRNDDLIEQRKSSSEVDYLPTSYEDVVEQRTSLCEPSTHNEKDPEDRKSANELMEHPFITRFQGIEIDLASFVKEARSSIVTSPVSEMKRSPHVSNFQGHQHGLNMLSMDKSNRKTVDYANSSEMFASNQDMNSS